MSEYRNQQSNWMIATLAVFCLLVCLNGCSGDRRPRTLTVHFKETGMELLDPDENFLESAKTPEQMFEIIKSPKYRKMVRYDLVIYRGKPGFTTTESQDDPFIQLAAKLGSIGITSGQFEYVNDDR